MAGKKLLLSGSGQCNFTNARPIQEFLKRCGTFSRFLKPALYAFSPDDFIRLLQQNGCESFARDDGKVFPKSLKASDVRDAMWRAAQANEAKIIYNCRITDIEARDGFRLTARDGRQFHTGKLIIAGGGASWPQTGSDGSAYELATQLGHAIRTPRPALAAISVEGQHLWRYCAGISLKDVYAVSHGKEGTKTARGDLLFTHSGLSGPLILDNSHLLARGDSIDLRLVENAGQRLPQMVTANPRKTLVNALKGFGLPQTLIHAILNSISVDPDITCANLTRADRVKIAGVLSALRFTVRDVESFATAMLTAGGVSLEEVKARGMASKLHTGLHFAGEVLDYNLPTGGFNIQAAASTGWLAGLS
jgi:predicted Rossmann fold flavoprotein